MKVKVKSLSSVLLFATSWTVAYQAPLSMGFSRQEYWSGLPFPSPGNLPDPGIEPTSLLGMQNSLPLSHQASPSIVLPPSQKIILKTMGERTALTYYTNIEENTLFQLKILYMLQCFKIQLLLSISFHFHQEAL